MNIGLVDVDGHNAVKKKWGATIYPNIALCKIARWHKQHGDTIEWAFAFSHYDIVYMSKVFNFSPDDLTVYDADRIVRGGTGYDICSEIPEEIDLVQPDYSIYPAVPSDTAYGFLTRGCPNKCKWCVVPRKEGRIRPYMDVDEIAIEGRTKLVLMDNNFLAAGDYAHEQLDKIIARGYKVDFNQALDARLVDDAYAQKLAKVKWLSHIRFGCDTQKQIEECERAMDMIVGYGFKGEFFLYTMLNDDLNECYSRIHYWWDKLQEARDTHQRNNAYAYAQPYRDIDNPHRPIPQWQKDMAHWCNNRAHFLAHSFLDFEPRKGFCCAEYFNLPDTGQYTTKDGRTIKQLNLF